MAQIRINLNKAFKMPLNVNKRFRFLNSCVSVANHGKVYSLYHYPRRLDLQSFQFNQINLISGKIVE